MARAVGEAQRLISSIMGGGAKEVRTRAEREGSELVPLLDQGDELTARPSLRRAKATPTSSS